MDWKMNDMQYLEELGNSVPALQRKLESQREDAREYWEEMMTPKYSEQKMAEVRSRFKKGIDRLEEENDNLESMLMSEVNKSLFTIIKERFINWLI